MKIILKRGLPFMLSVAIALSCVGCGKDSEKDTSSNNYSKNDPVSDWSLPVDGDADNSSSDASTVTGVVKKPEKSGSFESGSKVTEIFPESGDTDSDYPDYTKEYGLSDLSDTDSLQFFYQGITYAYGITKNGHERIALIDQNNGDWIDLLNGAGTITLKSTNNAVLVQTDGIDRFSAAMYDGFMTLHVYYRLSGIDASRSELFTEYVFKRNSIQVSQHVNCNSSYTISSENSILNRQLLQQYTNADKTMVGKWVYPNNGDYPYQVNESIGSVITFDEHHALYTFMKSISESSEIYRKSYPDYNIPLEFNDSKGISYTCEYSLVPATRTGDDVTDRYRALFSGRGANYAAGVFPADGNTENSTIFVGDSVTLNLNMTNLTDKDNTFSLRYDIRDYYGKIVDSGIFVNNTSYAGTSMDRKIRISGTYGMYYLNLYSITREYTHLECYPFALIPTSDYKYRSTNPFGIAGVEGLDTMSDYLLAAKLIVKIGAGNYRMSNTTEGNFAAVREMYKAGVKINYQAVVENYKDGYLNKVDAFQKNLESLVDRVSDFADSVEVGNEIDGFSTISGEYEMGDLMNRYINGMFLPAAETVHGKKMRYANAGSAGCPTGLFDALGKYWNKLDVLSVHAYGIPVMPDSCPGRSDYWNYEDALKRTSNAIKLYGNKELYVSETGYPTHPDEPKSVSLRTQADYNMRILVLGSSYGASRIQLYSFYDRKSYFNCYSSSDSELNFGLCYQPDFLGIVKPKPSIVAFAVISAVTDGLKKTEAYGKYTGGTLRTFKMEMQNGENVYAVWSNAHPQPNAYYTHLSDRKIGMPWVNEYQESETAVFETTGKKVTVTDIMGNTKTYTSVNGKVQIPVTGSLIYVKGIQ